ncbi:hypothetical protein Tco_1010039 [Tanacetum coccineum]
MYQEELKEHVSLENVVDLDNNKEEVQKKPRATRKRSSVWPHYELFVNDQGEQKSKYQYCDKRGDGDDRKMIAWKFNQSSVRRALAYMLIVDELPFKFVEGKVSSIFLNVSQPLFYTPSRITMARDCVKLYLEEKKKDIGPRSAAKRWVGVAVVDGGMNIFAFVVVWKANCILCGKQTAFL